MPEWLTGSLQVFDLRRSPFAGRAFRSGKNHHAPDRQGCQYDGLWKTRRIC
jgi:hypothetical protein